MPRIRVRPNDAGSATEEDLSTLLDQTFGVQQGTIVFRSGGGWQVLGAGTADGLVLTSGGPGADIYWASAGASYSAPAFSAFSISGQATSIEVGASVPAGSTTFAWTATNAGNVQANSIDIVDTTAGATLASGLANDGTEVISISAITNTAPAAQVWTIDGTNTHSATFSRTFSVNWFWRAYAGINAAATLTANQIKALGDSSGLQSGFAGTYSLSATGFKYFCSPDSLGSPTRFYDPVNGFLISMATSSDNAAYSNVAGGYSYAIVSVTNANGIATNYRVYRTQNSLGGTLTMQVS